MPKSPWFIIQQVPHLNWNKWSEHTLKFLVGLHSFLSIFTAQSWRRLLLRALVFSPLCCMRAEIQWNETLSCPASLLQPTTMADFSISSTCDDIRKTSMHYIIGTLLQLSLHPPYNIIKYSPIKKDGSLLENTLHASVPELPTKNSVQEWDM